MRQTLSLRFFCWKMQISAQEFQLGNFAEIEECEHMCCTYFQWTKIGKVFKSNTWLLILDPVWFCPRALSWGATRNFRVKYQESSIGFENLAYLQSIETVLKISVSRFWTQYRFQDNSVDLGKCWLSSVILRETFSVWSLPQCLICKAREPISYVSF